MDQPLILTLFIEPQQAGTYFTLPFTMPPDTESLTLTYRYERHHEVLQSFGTGEYVSRQEVNIIDLGLIDPAGQQVGVSGSDKTHIQVSETSATPGYRPWVLAPGTWQILVGAYKIAPEGVKVTYELSFTSKHLRLLKGDLHTHTLASDGVLTTKELGRRAVRHGLDFLAITDHNQMVSAEALPQIPGLTLIPGVEWTHFQGHANFLGVSQPFDGPFFTNTSDEALSRFLSARERGALITINHPFEEGMGFQFDLNIFPFDCLEIWNGPFRESNFRALGLWQNMLRKGQKIPVCGGSDYHRDTPFLFPGGPTTCVYALSAGTSDILKALRAGHSYIIFAPNGPSLQMSAGEALLGDSVFWSRVKKMEIQIDGLLAGDVVRVVTAQASQAIFQALEPGRFQCNYSVGESGFARVEVFRSFLPGLPQLPALISNPIYFDNQ